MITTRSWPTFCVAYIMCHVCLAGGRIEAEEPAPGELREIQFVGKDGEECVIAFRWCPSGVMKEGNPDDAEGMPAGQVEGFWLSETEVSQHDYRIIAGTEAMDAAKSYVLDNIAEPVANKTSDDLTENDRRAIEERKLAEKTTFADSALPLYGVPPGDADTFCLKLSEAYDRFKSATGRRADFSTLVFRLPTHYEWQYACRAESKKKHFAEWPESPENTAVGSFKNYREYLEKKNPDLYVKHQEFFDSFNGSETDMVRLLDDAQTTNDKEVRIYLEGLVQMLLPVEKSLRRVTDESPNGWNIRGLLGNVSEWVVVVAEPLADRTDVPYPGGFAKGNVHAGYAGGYSAPSGNVPWKSLSIWHWQINKYTSKNQDRVRGQNTGIRIVMMDAVAETWFADLRQMAEQAYDGEVSADELLGGFESGMKVVGRDKEGRSVAGPRIGIYGALAKARSGDQVGSSHMLHEAVVGLKESSDADDSVFFSQLEPLLAEDDLRN